MPSPRAGSLPKRVRVAAVAAIVWAAACGDAAEDVTGPPPAPNRGPVAVGAIPDRTMAAGERVSVDVSSYFRDPDGDALSYTATSSNDAAAGASVSGASVVVAAHARGVVTVTVTARDPDGLLAQQRFRVTVPNRGPEAAEAIPVQTVFAGQAVSVDASAYFSDPDGDALTYEAMSSDAEVAAATVAAATVTIRAVGTGVAAVTIRASDPDGDAAEQTVQVTVPNRGPEAVGEIPARTVPAGETATVDLASYFSDPDGDALAYAASSSNAGVAGASVSGSALAVAAIARGVAVVTVTARDPRGLAAQQTFAVTVPNRAPEAVTGIPGVIAPVGETVTVDASLHFEDPDGDALSYAAASSDPGVAAVSVSGNSVAVSGVAAGAAVVTVTVRDPRGLAAQQTFTVTVPNRAPEAVTGIPGVIAPVGETVTVDASLHFEDPDGDALSYAAVSSDPGVAAVSVSGNSVAVSGVADGAAVVTVTARDPDGLSAAATFRATVLTSRPGFQIELVFASPVTPTQEAAFVRAARRWEAVLAPTDLPDAALNATLGCSGGDPKFQRYVVAIDDLVIVAAVGEIDGRGGTLAFAGPCWIRSSSRLPFYGRMVLDEADLDRLERDGHMENTILHEMGHVLGIGILWEDLDLLRNPASGDEAPDTHFTGRRAIEAFDEAGGADYAGAKVPVENTGGPGTRNGHWREAVLVTELMTGYLTSGPEPLSAITVQSLADLGYLVDSAAADPYRLPGADAARRIDPERRIPYGDDIRRGPIVVADPDGRIVRVIPR
ncbi:Ig-like domain-containing protein [Candidatus Palauibacter sp.]|uniref:Ig-like domain-containing protein n=1 Tax=Candidatus Palauibacter sp. TaxID=3101350 RepID=UPI003B028792